MSKRLWIVLLALLLAGAGGIAAFWPFHSRQVLRLPGIVEIQEVRLGSKVGGRVEAVYIKEGEMVYPNQPLLVFEAPELKNQKDQLIAKLQAAEAEWLRIANGPRYEEKNAGKATAESAKARYDRIKAGWREEEQRQAKSERETAVADYEQAFKEWKRLADLSRKQAVAQSDLDAALGMRDRNKGKLDSARAREDMVVKVGSRKEDIEEARAEWERTRSQYEQLVNGSRWEDIAQAKAKVDELKANLEAIDINLKETTVVVPPNLGQAVVEVVAFRPGDLVQANQPVVRVLRVQDLWVKIFVPETQYGLITLNKKVEVTIDTHPGKIFQGVVIQRANISEFTPRNVQSVDERRHQVFGVKIHVDDPQGIFNAGMAAEVTIPLD